MNIKKGSFTVEMSLLLPVIIMSAGFCVYSLFFIHNEIILTARAYEVAITGSLEGVKRTGKVENLLKQKISELGKRDVLGDSYVSADYHIRSSALTIRISNSQHMNTLSRRDEVKVEVKRKVIKPVKLRWKMTVIKEILDK